MKKEKENSPGYDFASLSVARLKKVLSEKAYLTQAEVDQLAGDPRKGVHNLLSTYRRQVEKEKENKARLHNMSRLEKELRRQGYILIGGIDEAGRGPLAGPVVAAAVILDWENEMQWGKLNDSKKLTAPVRERLFDLLVLKARAIAVGIVDHALIDRMNIHQASLEAMRLAARRLFPRPHYLLCDGFFLPGLSIPQQRVVDGDARSLSIAAASIVAKVTRDQIMSGFDALYPGYGFDRHKGYPTVQHRRALQYLGPSPLHRHSFNWGSENL